MGRQPGRRAYDVHAVAITVPRPTSWRAAYQRAVQRLMVLQVPVGVRYDEGAAPLIQKEGLDAPCNVLRNVQELGCLA